ncbi:MAG: 4-(cytidine 5'-diphospho)-2-C-methyl-D-erythritol kinase [Rhodobacteraceae bacterium]|nr:4-(cytidine 5'-diphospho)-2-C-methyl-D-erythritol kinase [Paracoccaceae bacterium]
MKINSFAAAKVNLALHVRGLKSNGYHELHSLVTFANIGDIIEVRTSNELKLTIEGPFAVNVPKDTDNIVIKAAKFLLPDGKAHINLIKNLPVEAGLGGGSADAAATLRSLSKLWNIPIPKTPEVLGADVPICLLKETAIVQGIGEKITPVSIPSNLHIVLIKPNIGLSTAKVFNNLKNKHNEKMCTFKGTDSIEEFANYLNKLRNDLLQTSITIVPLLRDIINFLNVQKGNYYTQMSGSGTTCFGLFDDEVSAMRALSQAKIKFPNMWCKMVKLI